MEEDEIKKLKENQDISSSPSKVHRKTEADMKRRLFEEKLAKEQEERHQKKMIALKQQKEQEDVSFWLPELIILSNFCNTEIFIFKLILCKRHNLLMSQRVVFGLISVPPISLH